MHVAVSLGPGGTLHPLAGLVVVFAHLHDFGPEHLHQDAATGFLPVTDADHENPDMNPEQVAGMR